MTDFVEASLETLVPVLEQLGSIQLLNSDELSSFIKRCRRYEYRLQKIGKTEEDFLLYADYLNDVVSLIRVRREHMNYWHKVKIIDRVILKKVLSLLRRCCDRFQGRFDVWRKYIDFLKKYKFPKDLSKAYTRALLINAKDIDLHCEAALWELVDNASVENSRTSLQLALRSFPQNVNLYATLFKVELLYVEKILERRRFLNNKPKLNKDDSDNEAAFDIDVDDAIMDLRVAQVVMISALKVVDTKDKAKLLIELWKSLSVCKLSNGQSAARLMDLIEKEVELLDKEDAQSFDIERKHSKGEDYFDCFDEAITQCNTEKMHRLYLKFCLDNKSNPVSSSVISRILQNIIANGWASESDFNMIQSNHDAIFSSESASLLEKSIKLWPNSHVLWTHFLQQKVDDFDSAEDPEKVLELFNEAFQKISGEDSYPLWEMVIDFSIENVPENVEQIFKRGIIISCPFVSSKLKILRLKYFNALVEENKMTVELRDKKLAKLMEMKPNQDVFYIALAEDETVGPEISKLALNYSVNENGKTSVDSWIELIKFLMKTEPSAVAAVYQRAVMTLEKDLCEDFVTRWTQLQVQSVVSDSTDKKHKRSVSTDNSSSKTPSKKRKRKAAS